MSVRDLLTAVLVVVIWGLNFIAMKWGLRSFTPFELGTMRYIVAALPMVFLMRPPRIGWRWVVVFGMFQGVGQFSFGFFALKVGMTAALASVLMQTQMFFTALFAWVVLREELSRSLLLGMVLAALGLCCFGMSVANAQGAGTSGVTLAGIALTLCAAASWSVSNIITRLAQRAAPGYDPIAFVVWSCPTAILAFVGLVAATEPDAGRWLHADAWRAVPALAWASVAYLGWVATILAYGLWTRLLTRYPANRVAPFGLGVPLTGLAGGMLVLGEVITPWQWVGVAFMVASLLCVVLGGRRSPR